MNSDQENESLVADEQHYVEIDSICSTLASVSMSENTIQNSSFESSSSSSRSYICHLFAKGDEGLELTELQFEHILTANRKNLDHLDVTILSVLTKDTAGLFFHLCKELGLEGVVKVHAMEIYDRWVSAICRKSVGVSEEARQEMTNALQEEMLLRMVSCIQLSAKMIGPCIRTTALQKLLAKFEVKVNVEDILVSEFDVFQTLKFNLNTLTPLEITGHILLLLQVDMDEFHDYFAFCVTLCYITYLDKDNIYENFQNRVQKKYGTVFTDDEMVQVESDMVLRSAAITQVAMFLNQTERPDLNFLHRLVNIIQSSSTWEHIYELALCIFNALSPPKL